jgi:SAM-dependent methyltransferase
MLSTTEDEKNEICRHVAGFDRPRVLEVGAFKGETTRLLAEVVSERRGYVVVIDPMRWSAELVSNGLERHLPRALNGVARRVERLMGAASYERAFWATVGDAKAYVHLRRARSDDDALTTSDEPILERFDVVFIDGDHSYRGAANDLRAWGRRVAPGGVILVHDAVPAFPGVMRALSEFERESVVQVEWPLEGTLAVVRVDRDLRSAASAVEELSRPDAAE